MNVDKDLEELMRPLGKFVPEIYKKKKIIAWEFGPYQRRQVILLLFAAVTAGVHMLSLVTVAAIPEHRCLLPNEDRDEPLLWNSTQVLSAIPQVDEKLDSCKLFDENGNDTIACTEWIFDKTYYKSSRAMEWNFVCDRRWMGAVAQTAYMFGVFTGAATLGGLADRIGRKKVFYACSVLQLILGVAVAFVPEFYTFLIVRYLYGIVGSAGAYITGFVLAMELVGASKRTASGLSFQAAFAGGLLLVAFWGWLLPHDRVLLQVVYGLHSLLLIGHWWLIDESPVWLWTQGRKQEAAAIVRKALKVNGTSHMLDEEKFLSKRQQSVSNEEPSAGVLGLLRTPNLRKKTLNVCLNWFANSLAYYGLSLSTGALPGNPYVMLFVTGLVEFPSYMLTVFLMDRMGRRSLISSLMIIGGTACIIAACFPQETSAQSSAVITIVMIGKFAIAGSFAIIYNYTAELFPTVVRSTAVGIGGMCARLSGAITPLLILLDSLDKTLPVMIFASIAIISGFLSLFLPETLNQPLPQTLEDGENFGVGDTAFSSCVSKRNKKYDIPLSTVD
ncbi:hypothetical protein RUM44_012617 [Polyplax serrata]|uniref:Major facilitator superfamily (MFS) profile domain-containing protein n=1 Tax=Polyplax serrata TaxID=468196 RepID=A0ABR1BFL0_POLSC